MEKIASLWYWFFGSSETLIFGYRNYRECRWCGYGIFPGEVHESCETLLKRYKCQTCGHPETPGKIHFNCKNFQKGLVKYPNCKCCGKVLIPGKNHFPCELELMYGKARLCKVCGFRILTSEKLSHSACKRKLKK